MPHSPEPWKINDDGTIVGSDGSEVCDSVVGCRCHDDPAAMSEDDKDRIVACVNALKDAPDPQALISAVKRIIRDNYRSPLLASEFGRNIARELAEHLDIELPT